MNKKIKTLLIIISAWIVLGIGIFIGITIKFNTKSPVFIYSQEKENLLSCDEEIRVRVQDNYYAFLLKSYILVGDYPDCSYYKIVSEVPRNDFDTENFYIDDDSDKMFYHDDSGKRISKIVIDVSEYQGEIDWKAIKACGVDLAIIRVGFRGYGAAGKLVEDETFRTNLEGARKNNIKAGVYFFSQAVNYQEGEEEAEYVLSLIKKYKVDGPVVIDTEYVYDDEARTADLGVTERTDSVVAFCKTVEKAGYEAMIYASRNWFAQDLDMTRLGDYKLWVASYCNELEFPYAISGWQYTGEGYIDGIEGTVDLNVWFDN